MNKRKTLRVVIGFLCCLLLGGMALAISSDNYRIDWDVIAGGGEPASSASHTMRSTIGQTAIGPSSSVNFQLGAGYWYGVRMPLPPDFAFVKMWFLDEEGEPYPFVAVMISNGIWRKEWKDVTHIETEVPITATYTCIYHWEGEPPPPESRTASTSVYHRGSHAEMEQFELTLQPGERREFELYAIDPTQQEERIRPHISMQEVGANASIRWEWDPEINTLTYNVSGEAGKFVGLEVLIDSVYTELPDYALSECGFEQNFEVDWRWPPWKSSAKWSIHIEPSEVSDSLTFAEIDPDNAILGVRRALYNDAIIDTFTTTLRSIDGVPYEQEFLYPQYAPPPGNYLLGWYYPGPEIYLPFDLSPDKPQIIDIYPPKIIELEPFTFFVIAENFFANSSYSNLIHDAEAKKITVDVSTETPRDWWGCFVLPEAATVAAARALDDGGIWHNLDELYDYTINPVDSYNLVVVRIGPTIRHISLTYGFRIYLPLVMKNHPIVIQLKP